MVKNIHPEIVIQVLSVSSLSLLRIHRKTKYSRQSATIEREIPASAMGSV
jgi:hypothetical protein